MGTVPKAELQPCPWEPWLTLPLASPPLCRKEAGGTKVPKEEGGDLAQRRAAGDFTFWQDSRNSSIVTTPSLFRSIFCRQAQHRGHSRESPSPGPTGAGHSAPLAPGMPHHQQDQHSPASSPVGCFLLHPLQLCAGALLPQDVLSSPGRSSPRAPGVPPPAWPGRCICPSCHRWTS